jgi:hypothetical protein
MSGMLAKVINSTVGTSTFKSLDEVLTGDKSIVASDEVYQSFPNELKSLSFSVTTSNSVYDLFTFTLPLDGSCNIRYKTYWNVSSQTDTITLEAYKNGVMVFSNSTGNDSDDPETNLYIEGKKGDTFTLKLKPKRSSGTARFYLYSINATVVDSKTMNIVSLM